MSLAQATSCLRFDALNSRGVGSQSARVRAIDYGDFAGFTLYCVETSVRRSWVSVPLFTLGTTPELKGQRHRYAHEMTPVLETAAKDGWHHLVTRDESWFFQSYSPRRARTFTRDSVVIKPKQAKFMFMVMWNLLGFHVTVKLPTGARMNNEYSITNILARLEKTLPMERAAHAKRFTLRSARSEPHKIPWNQTT
jgi:hypothetical protein